jgi:pyruvate kinase
VSRARRTPVNAIADAVLHVKEGVPSSAKPGDRIEFEDARARKRVMTVSANEDRVLIAEIEQSAYLVPETVLEFHGRHKCKLHLTDVPAKEQPIVLKPGDVLILTNASVRGKPAVYDQHERLLFPAHIGVTLPEVFQDVQPGHKIWLDDGKIGGIVRSVESDQIKVELTHACPTGSNLRADKGINLPDTALSVQALTDKDIHDLAFIASHADMVGYSFVRSERDIALLQEELAKLDAQNLGIVLKVETRHAFENLPRLLLAAMKSERFGVMIARGDLAVECGYERTAEVQEEILWICEAAHAPVIWATQVLESLAKTGIPSRAEVTDAAMSERAECVMLNKGPFILNALATLDDILRRMQTHQSKKRPMLRPLRLAHTMLCASGLKPETPFEPAARNARA